MQKSNNQNNSKSQPGPLQLLVSPDLTLSPFTGLYHWAHLQLAPASTYLRASGLTPITDLHCQTHTHGETVQPQEGTLTAMASTVACGRKSDAAPCHWV